MGKLQNDPVEVHNPEPAEYQPDPPEPVAPDAIAGAGLTAQDIADASLMAVPPTTDERDARIQSLELTVALIVHHLGGMGSITRS